MSKQLIETLGTLERRMKQERHVLVVDDSAMDREILVSQLQELGCICEQAEDCGHAVDKISSGGRFDACLLDLRMPGMDGLSCVPRLKKADPKIRIVLCTGYPEGITTDSLRSIGVLTLLLKPTTTEDLQRMFREFNL